MEQEIQMQTEPIIYTAGGGAVDSVNGYTGVVVLTTSDLENTSDYQTGSEVKSAISTAIAGKQDTLTAGSNITIASDNTISATDTTYSAGNGLNLTGTEFSADTTVLATQNDLSGKQNTLTAGSNISISGDTISATDTTYSNFVGTDGTASGTAGLVPAPATTDAGKFLKADGTWAEAGGGGNPGEMRTLTTDDYNYPVADPKGVAIWLLPTGSYQCVVGSGVKIYPDSGNSGTNYNGVYIVDASSESNYVKYLYFTTMDANPKFVNITKSTGTVDSTLFVPSTVQTTGTSTFEVMSQNAVTSMVFADPSTKHNVWIGSNNQPSSFGVQIGLGSWARGVNSMSLGRSSAAYKVGSVALGAYSQTSYIGEVNIGSSQTSAGYLGNSNYRLLSGVYDGQSAHDAATVGQLNSRIIGSLTSAPTTSTAGAVGALVATVESGTGHLYICTNDTGESYTWQQLV